MVKTKKLILQEFKKLLSKYSLDKITVSQITDKCNIKRQTFYYHFSNIDDLISYGSKSYIKDIIGSKEFGSWQKKFIYILETIKEEKDSKRKSMAPLFDYSDSFYSKFSVYQNEIMDLKMVKESFQKDMMNYPKIYEYLKKMQEVDLIFLLSEFASKYNLNLTDEIKYYYAKEEERSKELIKKIM